jgi:hypothetical protein
MNYFVEKNKSEALKNFVIYQKRKKESNIIKITIRYLMTF